MFGKLFCIVSLVLGMILLVSTRAITNFIFHRSPRSWFDTPLRRGIFSLIFGAMICLCMVFAIMIAVSIPDKVSLNYDRNKLQLLENGVVIAGRVKSARYYLGTSSGWTVYYEFDAKDPETGKVKTYMGDSSGPKKYYYGLSPKEAVTVIYDPCNPGLNCEIRRFLNHPSFRYVFKKAGKLSVLNKLGRDFEMEEYSFHEWYRQQRMSKEEQF